ncbi:MAG: hypothetical protein R3234_00855 [Thermoanaerobaculia bacterium]|nr:hypothetical protein [Thermoanaerobaculia bacterium]
MSQIPDNPGAAEEGGPSPFEAEYQLESPAVCPCCERDLETVGVIRLLRVRVNFSSTLPRRGYLVACPHCRGILPADLRIL